MGCPSDRKQLQLSISKSLLSFEPSLPKVLLSSGSLCKSYFYLLHYFKLKKGLTNTFSALHRGNLLQDFCLELSGIKVRRQNLSVFTWFMCYFSSLGQYFGIIQMSCGLLLVLNPIPLNHFLKFSFFS